MDLTDKLRCHASKRQKISDSEMRAVCAKVIQIAPEQEEEFLFALRAACARYLRERSIFLVNSKPSTPCDPMVVPAVFFNPVVGVRVPK
jgi:hypothetical protein